jgi:hypothetical protein
LRTASNVSDFDAQDSLMLVNYGQRVGQILVVRLKRLLHFHLGIGDSSHIRSYQARVVPTGGVFTVWLLLVLLYARADTGYLTGAWSAHRLQFELVLFNPGRLFAAAD